MLVIEEPSFSREVQKKMETLDKRKANRPYKILFTWVPQVSAKELRTPLHILFINSLSQGELPNLWKTVNTEPLYKKSKKSEQ